MMWDLCQYSDNTAIIDENGTTITYGTLEREGNKITDVIGKRCLVFLLCKNVIGSIIGYTAFIDQKIVPVLLNSQLEKGSLDKLLSVYRPSYLWIPDEDTIRFPDMEVVYSAFQYSLLKNDNGVECPLHPELGLLLTTSGSTGSPKFIRQSYKNIKVNADSIMQYLGLNERERPITTLPMNYTYGLSVINSHLLVGATLLVTDRSLMQREFWGFFKDMEATSLSGVPYTYEMLDKMRFQRMGLPDSFKTLTQAGGKLTPALHKKFAAYAQANGKKFIVMYGQCEATARMGYLPAENALEKCGSMGIAIPGGKFHLIDEDGQEISTPYITGELVYEGENVTLGYAECLEDLVKGDERGGILLTGDMAQCDGDGFYYIVGRKKRFLKIYGNRVNLDEVDRLIKARFDNMDCASTGVDDHMYLFVTDAILADEVRQYIISKTGLNRAAFKVITIDEIPKNDAGKTLYKELEIYYR